MCLLRRVAGLSHRDRVKSSDIWEQLKVSASTRCREQLAGVVWASDQNASWTPPWGGASGISILEENPGQTWETLLRLYHLSGLGSNTLGYPQRSRLKQLGRSVWACYVEADTPPCDLDWRIGYRQRIQRIKNKYINKLKLIELQAVLLFWISYYQNERRKYFMFIPMLVSLWVFFFLEGDSLNCFLGVVYACGCSHSSCDVFFAGIAACSRVSTWQSNAANRRYRTTNGCSPKWKNMKRRKKQGLLWSSYIRYSKMKACISARVGPLHCSIYPGRSRVHLLLHVARIVNRVQ